MNENDYTEWSAAYVMGSLNLSERLEFEAHLDGCGACRQRVVEFSPIPSLLSLLDEADLTAAQVDVSDEVVARVAAASREDYRGRRRWRAAAMAMTAVAAALALLVVLAPGSSDQPADVIAAGRELSIGSSSPITGSITLSEQPWGTLVVLDLFDVPKRDQYSMWTVATDGAWTEVGSWSWSPEGTCGVPGATSLPPHRIARIVVTGAGDRDDQLVTGV